MIRRLLDLLKSLKTKEKIHETEVSTTVDDMTEGRRSTFDQTRVRQLLEKSDLLEPTDNPS